MKNLIILLFIFPYNAFTQEVNENKFGETSVNIIPVYINTGFTNKATKFELNLFSKNSQTISTLVGILFQEKDQFELSFGLKFYVKDNRKFSLIFSPNFNYGKRKFDMRDYSSNYSSSQLWVTDYFYSEIYSYYSISTLAGVYFQIGKYLNLSCLVGPSFLMKNKDVEWREDIYLTFAPSIGCRF